MRAGSCVFDASVSASMAHFLVIYLCGDMCPLSIPVSGRVWVGIAGVWHGFARRGLDILGILWYAVGIPYRNVNWIN